MSSSFNRIKKNIIEAMQSTNNQGTSAYDSVAEVRRVEGDTAWVHIAGGVDETPVKLTIAAKAGDVVQVRVGGGRAWITGNASAPPTDDKTAIAAKSLADIAGNRANTAKVAAEAAQVAADGAQVAADGAQADIDSQKEYFWHDANGAHVLGSKTAATRYRTDIDSEGMHIKDVSGEVQEVAKFTADGTQIGKTGEAHQELDYHSWRLTDKDGNVFAEVKDLRGKDGTATIIAKFKGDGETTEFSLPVTATEIVDITVDGTSTEATLTELNTEIKFVSAPAQKAKIICTYKTDDERAKSYTFGKRVANKNTGAYSFAEGINAVASGKCSHSEGLGGYAEGNCSHAEGWATTASEDCAHAEGIGTHAKGYCSHAEGKQTEAQGDWSHSAGYRTIAGFDNQMVIGSYNDNKEDSLFEIGNGTYRSHSNAFRVTKDGKAYDGERCLSDIGTVYMAEKGVAITTADIHTRVKGATITVPAGIYVICGEWIFDTSSTTGARNINLDIYVGENMEARSRVYANAKDYASLHASTIVVLDATTELSVRGSSSKKSPAERTRIRAVRIK